MRVNIVNAIAICSLAVVHAAGPWNSLRVTWPQYNSLPTTISDAVTQGWIADSTCGSGGISNRYYKTGENRSVMLHFNSAGQVGGVQTCFSPSHPTDASLPVELGVVLDGNTYNCLTMFFRDPTTMCTSLVGDTAVGSGLWVKEATGSFTTLITDLYSVPSQPFWVEGKCFPTMGVHYWGADINPQTPASSVYPVFLLYNGGMLNGFGWVLSSGPNEDGGKRWEHPSGSMTALFLPDHLMPTEVLATPSLSTIHFFFNEPTNYFCGAPTQSACSVQLPCGSPCLPGSTTIQSSGCGFLWASSQNTCSASCSSGSSSATSSGGAADSIAQASSVQGSGSGAVWLNVVSVLVAVVLPVAVLVLVGVYLNRRLGSGSMEEISETPLATNVDMEADVEGEVTTVVPPVIASSEYPKV